MKNLQYVYKKFIIHYIKNQNNIYTYKKIIVLYKNIYIIIIIIKIIDKNFLFVNLNYMLLFLKTE